MITEADIDKHYDAASAVALQLVEHRARAILKAHPNLTEFMMGMGTYFFTDRENQVVNNPPKYMAPVYDLLEKWDEVLKLSGEPMRFTADGLVIHNW